jgi:phage terminase large subunit-like protein
MDSNRCIYTVSNRMTQAGDVFNLITLLWTQVMKAGTTLSQRRRLGDTSLIVAMDPQTKRLLRYEEVNLQLLLCMAIIDFCKSD